MIFIGTQWVIRLVIVILLWRRIGTRSGFLFYLREKVLNTGSARLLLCSSSITSTVYQAPSVLKRSASILFTKKPSKAR